jgi:type IV secretion system protein VirD4
MTNPEKTSSQPHLIAVSKLEKSPLNARRTVVKVGMGELKASLLAHGLMQNLVVTDAGDGSFRVIAGGRRLEAIQSLQAEGKLPKELAVPCQIVSENHALEMSLAENTVRLAMHPADQFEAFAALIEQGESATDVACRFGVEESLVLKRMRLARVAPELLAEYRSEGMTLECLMAYTITDDHHRQLKVFTSLPNWSKNDPDAIRAALTEKMVESSDKLACFVGQEAYVAAGGSTRADLFGNEVYFEKPALVHKLANEKLDAIRQELEAEGWGWVEIHPDRDHDAIYRCGRLKPQMIGVPAELVELKSQLDSEREAIAESLDEEESDTLLEQQEAVQNKLDEVERKLAGYVGFDATQKKLAGCFVSVGHDGSLCLDQGLVKPEQRKLLAKLLGEVDDKPVKAKPKHALPESLRRDLAEDRLQAAKVEIARHPDIALDLLAFQTASTLLGKQPICEGPNVEFKLPRPGKEREPAVAEPRVPSDEACKQFRSFFERTPPRQLLRLNHAVHTAVFAPTGVGKGVSIVLPHLLTCPDSMVVVDFKGENADITARERLAMGHNIVLLDPFRVTTQTPDTFNPLDTLDPSNPLALDECRALAESLVVRTGQEKEPHWNDAAEIVITAIIAAVACFAEAKDRSLQTVRTVLADPDKFQATVKLMCGSDAWGGMLSRLGHQLTHFKDKELNSTMTTTGRHLRFLDTLAIAESTTVSSFDPADLINGKMTIYLVIPPEHMRTQSALLRLWIGSLLRAVVRGGLQDEHKVQFVLDEAAALGHMDALDDAVDKFRGYGVRLLFLYQSVGQLKRCFPDGQDQTLLSNVTQVFFGVNDNETAKYVSERLGKGTIVVDSGGRGKSTSYQEGNGQSPGSTSHSDSNNDNWQQSGRELLQPNEVMALDKRIAITFIPGLPPIWTILIRYYEKEFRSTPGEFWPAIKALCKAMLFAVAAGFFAVAATKGVCEVRSSVPAVAPVVRQRWVDRRGLGRGERGAIQGKARSKEGVTKDGGRGRQPVTKGEGSWQKKSSNSSRP